MMSRAEGEERPGTGCIVLQSETELKAPSPPERPAREDG